MVTLALGMIAFSLWWVRPSWEMLQLAKASTSWTQAEAQIDFARSEFHRVGGANSAQNYHQPVVRYHFEVDGQRHEGDRVRFADLRFRDRTGAARSQEIIDRYAGHPKVPVFHDPEDPTRSVLEPGVTAGTFSLGANVFIMLLLGVGLLAFDAWLLWPSLKLKFTQRGRP